MRRTHPLAALAALALLAACRGPAVPNPMTGGSFYLCCNIRYEKQTITDVNYLRGTLIPLGTRVQVLEVGRNRVNFQPAGHPPITLALRYGRKELTMDQYLDRLFLRDDPRARLPRSGKGGKAAADAEKTRRAIEQGAVEVGMTREQVLMAIGHPPAHRTPSLESPLWTYWANRWETYEVRFDGNTVAGVSR